MTSMFSSLFGFRAEALASRIESMQKAEAALMNFAVSRFNDSGSVGLFNDDPPTHTLKLFDTRISRSTVPLKDGKDCQMGSALCKNKNGTDCDEKNSSLTLHGVEVTSHIHDGDKSEAPLVLLHGYANGALYFYRNLLGLSNKCFGGKVYALDMLGWGLSSRPKFQLKKMIKGEHEGQNNKKKGSKQYHDDTYATEQVFVESLEEWRKAHNIDKMVLGGHSMGGYLSVAYCEKYPQNVERLILMSPAGVPDDRNVDIEARLKDASYSFKAVYAIIRNLFYAGVTPSAFLRNLPEKRGRGMVTNYVEGRLPAINCPEEKKHLIEYLYTNAVLPGSGEECLNKILKPTTFAHKPTLHRIPRLKVKNVAFIYGQDDWMDPTGGIETMEICNKMRRTTKNSGNGGSEGEEEEHHAPEVQVYGVKNAGHLLMLENWKEFNSAVIMSAGKEHTLPMYAPRPYQVSERHSNIFFGASRWTRKDDASNGGNVSTA